MQTNRVIGRAILAAILLAGAVALCISMLGGISGLTTGDWSTKVSAEMFQGFDTTNVELTAAEKEARTHTLEDQQKFLEKHADVAAIKMVDTMPAASLHLFDSEKTPEMLENNCWFNQLTKAYEYCEAAYREDKGDTFVDGPVNDFTTNYANAKSGLDDEKYMEVASAKSRVDLMFFYMKTCHIVDVCTYRKDEQNDKTVAEHPVLFMASEAQCSKATQAKDEFEKGAGAALLQEVRVEYPECASPTTTNPTPTTTTTTTTTVAPRKCDTLDGCLSVNGRELSGTVDDKRNAMIGILSVAGQCTVEKCQGMNNAEMLQLCASTCVPQCQGMHNDQMLQLCASKCDDMLPSAHAGALNCPKLQPTQNLPLGA